jgi:branched-chain amino acid transport system permease protein
VVPHLPLAFNEDLFAQLCVNGLTAGSLYALIALGFSMVYGILKLLNFAHGDVLMIGAFVGYFTLTNGLGGPTALSTNIVFTLVIVFGAAMLASGFLGVAIERFAYRPLRNAPRIAPLISALGVAFFLQNSALLLFGADFRTYSSFELDGGVLVFNSLDIGPMHLPLLNIICIVTAVGLMLVLAGLVRFTRMGKAMRATAFDREAAAMMGIDPDRVIVVTFFIGSALAGAAGVMFGLLYGQVFHLMGLLAGLKGFIAAVIGGIGSIPGAMLGGLLLGFAEAFAVGYLPQGSTFQNIYVFLILIVFLLIRPQGIMGRPDIQKV